MVMRCAATLASTAERQFLAMVNIGRDGRELGMDRRDMLDLLQLDRRWPENSVDATRPVTLRSSTEPPHQHQLAWPVRKLDDRSL
jgi:hypothetical protein